MDQFFLDCLVANNIRSFLIILYTPHNIHLDSYLAFLTLFLLANLIVLYLCLGTWSGFLFWTGSSFAQGHISSYEFSICDYFILLSTLCLHWTVFTCGLSVTSLQGLLSLLSNIFLRLIFYEISSVNFPSWQCSLCLTSVSCFRLFVLESIINHQEILT